MAKKKKESKKVKEEIEEEEVSSLANILHADAKKSLLLLFLLTFGLLSMLGFFDAAGLLGHWIDMGIGSLFGYGKWLLPILLFTLAGLMLFRKTTTAKEAVKYVGLIVIYLTILALIHLFMGDDAKSYLKVAEAGEGGGYLGYVLATGFFVLAGKAAAAILLLALFIAGLIMAFNVSFIGFLEGSLGKVMSLFSRREEEDEESENVGEMEEGEGEEEILDEEDGLNEEVEALQEHNISHVEFPDEDEEEFEEEVEEEVDEEEEEVPVKKKRRRRSRYAWLMPSPELLESNGEKAVGGDIEQNKSIIQKTLKYFGVDVIPGEVKEGPTVTQYTFTPALGVKISRITTLNNDLALALAKHPIRIEAPIPGKSLVGIEVPNKQTARVRMRNVVEGKEFKDRPANLMLALGQDVGGRNRIADLRKMPHLLIAGRTGSGKSVCINTLLISLLYQNSPEDLKLILVDPKRVELSAYKGIPHLKTEVIVENKKVVNVLKWAVAEMERRYKILEEAKVRELQSYREKYSRGETVTRVNLESNEVTEEPMENLPYIVIVIDEMADLMSAHGKEVEALIIRLAQMSRAIGIHLILATQRPSVEVLTGLIKANIPTRIAFQVTTQIDSRTILDSGGAEKLIGNGDMLYSSPEGGDAVRLQGVFVSDDEVKKVTNFLRQQKIDLGDDEEEDVFGSEDENDPLIQALNAVDDGAKEDDMYEKAKSIVIDTGRASTTYLQTALGIGYPRGARLMHLLEQNGVVGMVDGKKKVLVGKASMHAPDEDEQKYGDDHLREEREREKWQL
jgi:S-DNA-T family DNA segregation ATPase FtsK/SpoIIIE